MTNRNTSKTSESRNESNDTQDEGDESRDSQGITSVTTWAQASSLIARCKLTIRDGVEYLMVPMSEFRWVIAIPHTSVVKIEHNGSETRKVIVPRRHEVINDDWGEHVEVWLQGTLMPPFKRLSVYIDREDVGFPEVKWELIG